MVSAVVLMKVEIGAVEAVANALVSLKGITQVFSVAGSYDLVALASVRENDDLADLVSGSIRKVAGITSTETLIAFRVYTPEELRVGLAFGD